MKIRLLLGVAMALCLSGAVLGAPSTDVVQFPTDYFVPDESSTGLWPYYRWFSDDWGWTHNPMAAGFATAELNISSWDVDWANGEVDVIYAYDAATASWVNLGSLTGQNGVWSYSTFTLGASLFDDIAAGLQVKMDIDSTNDEATWAVTLAKSVLTVDGGTLPDPDPDPVIPEPASMTLIGIGMLGLARLRKRLFQ